MSEPAPAADPGDARPPPEQAPDPQAPNLGAPNLGAPSAPAQPAQPAQPEPPVAPEQPAPPPPAPTVAAPARPRASCLRGFLVLLVLALLLLVFGPWLLTHSFLTRGLSRSLQGVGGAESGLGRAQLGWRDGLLLEQLRLSDPPPGAPELLVGLLRLETDLIRLGSGAAFGAPVSARLEMREARIELLVPPAQLSAAPPTPEEGAGPPFLLPFPLRPALDVYDLHLHCTWTPGAASPRRLVLRGMRAEGGGQIERDLTLDLDQGFSCQLEGLRLERLAGPDGPAATLLALERPRFTTRRLQLPPLALFSLNQVHTELATEVPVLRAGNLRLTDARGSLSFADGQARIALGATAPQGRMELESALDLRDPARWPATLRLGLHQVQLTGDLAHAAPLLVPLLRAHTWQGGRGLPPVTLGLDGRLDLLYDPAGALDWTRSLDTLTGQGTCQLGPGQLSASLLIDGYLRALTGLGVSSLLRGVIPQGWPTSGVEARFELPGQGRVLLPRLVVRSPAVSLEMSGETRFSGQFQLTVKTEGEGKQGLLAVLEAIDDVGGIRLQGDLVQGTVTPVLPDLPALLEAARKRGVLELLQEQVTGGSLREALQELQGKLPR